MNDNIEIIIERAVEKGITNALKQIGCNDINTIKDMEEIRDILNAWRCTKRTIWESVVRIITTGVLIALLIGMAIKLKIIGELK